MPGPTLRWSARTSATPRAAPARAIRPAGPRGRRGRPATSMQSARCGQRPSRTQCFDRTKPHADRAVWQYGTYNRNDGTRVDVANPGFPVTATYAGASYYGFASYWGINFQGLDLNSIADAQPIPSLTVTDQ